MVQEEVKVAAAHKHHKKHEYALDNIPQRIPIETVEYRYHTYFCQAVTKKKFKLLWSRQTISN